MKNQDNKNFLLDCIKRILNVGSFQNIYYGHAEPLPKVSCPLNIISRINIYLKGKVLLFASFDGKVGGKEMIPGDVFFSGKSGWAYSNMDTEYSQVLSIIFMESYMRLVYSECNYDKLLEYKWYHTLTPAQANSMDILKCLNRIMFEKNTKRDLRMDPLIRTLLYQVIEEVEHDSSKLVSRTEKLFNDIIFYTQQYYHSPINRASVAQELDISPSSLSAVFQKNSMINFNAYLNKLRMDKAEFLLKNYELSIERISEQCGFTSSGYFIKAFKKYFGVTPGRFRKRVR